MDQIAELRKQMAEMQRTARRNQHNEIYTLSNFKKNYLL